MDVDPVSNSQTSTQGVRETQEVSSQAFDNSFSEEIVWGRLLSVRRNGKVIHLVNDRYKFGRGEVDYRFNEELLDRNHLATISKLHFELYRTENSKSETSNNSKSETITILEDKSQNGTYVNKLLIGKNNKRILTSNDEISLSTPQGKVFVFYDSLNNDADQFPEELTEKYTVTRKLGVGTYGEVRLAYTQGSLNRVAVKILKKGFLSANGTTFHTTNINQIYNEIQLLRSVRHPCIVQLLDITEGPENIYIIMELAEGGELFDRISINKRLTEPIAKMFFYQLVHAVLHLHKNKITHRDIKPENILLESDEEYTRIKLTDFGLSKLTQNATLMTSMCGTPTYIAPELLALKSEGTPYCSKVDMWSVGVVLFVCLAGYAPFNGKTEPETERNIKKGLYRMRKEIWSQVSDDAKDLIRKLLVVDPQKRLSAEQTLKHQWLDDPDIIKRAQNLMNPPVRSPPKRPLEVDQSEMADNKTPRLMSGIEFTANNS